MPQASYKLNKKLGHDISIFPSLTQNYKFSDRQTDVLTREHIHILGTSVVLKNTQQDTETTKQY